MWLPLSVAVIVVIVVVVVIATVSSHLPLISFLLLVAEYMESSLINKWAALFMAAD